MSVSTRVYRQLSKRVYMFHFDINQSHTHKQDEAEDEVRTFETREEQLARKIKPSSQKSKLLITNLG